MKKSFKKSLMILLSIIMVMTMAMPVAFAEETAAVDITFADATMEANSETGLRITNLINQKADNAAVEGYYVEGGVITFNFSQEMNVDTLTPENIIITLENGDYIRGTDAQNFDAVTLEWGYEPYAKTGTTYSIAISDMCEGIKKHTVTFTSGVKTADNVAINEVTKNFVTGRIATTQGFEGKYLKDVACGKTVLHQNSPTGVAENYFGVSYSKMTTYVDSHNDTTTYAWLPGGWLKIDLGNYYTIADVAAYLPGNVGTSANSGVSELQIRYSCDPDEDGTTASDLGTISGSPFELAYATKTANGIISIDGVGGLGSSSWLHPANTVRARYIFVKSPLSHPKYANIGSLKVLATVESDYGQLTVTKSGSTVEEFAGAGEYVVSVPVTEYKAGSSNNYMIVAGYDANGVVTMINCKQVTEIVDGKLSLATTFTDTTKSLKAVLIKDFTQPQMLTDALILPAPAAAQE